MATPPVLVATYQTAWSSNSSPVSTSVTTAVGDVLVCVGTSEDASTTLATPTGGTGLTWTLRQSVVVSSYTTAYVWTATAVTAETFTMSITASGGGVIGFGVRRYSGSGGYDSSSKTNVSSGAPSLAITTTTDNCAIVVISSDWAAVDGTSRTWRTVNSITPTSGNGGEINYYRNASIYATYAASWSDAGTAGSKTVGLSAPSGQKYSIVACAIKGAAGGSTPIAVDDTASATEALTETATAPLADTAAAAEALTETAAAPLADAGSTAEALTVAAPIALTDAASATDAATVAAAVPLGDAGSAADTLATPAKTIPLADTASSAEALAATATVALADAGAAADALDAGLGTAKSLADAGAASDAAGVVAVVPLTDTGAAADALDNGLGTSKSLADTGTAGDALTAAATVALADAAAAADTLTTAAAATLADAAAAADTLTTPTRALGLADAAAAAEALTAAAAAALADAATAADTLIGADDSNVAKTLTDAGHARDHLHAVLIRRNTGVTPRPNAGVTVRPAAGVTYRP